MSSFAPDPVITGTGARRRSPVRRALAVLIILLALGVCAGAVAAVLAMRSGSDIKPGQKVQVTIPNGANADVVARVLADKGVVRNRTVFRARLRMNNDGDQFKPGTYSMLTVSSYDAIVRKLEKGPPAAPTFKIVFPEGFRYTEMAHQVDGLRASTRADGRPPLPDFDGASYLQTVRSMRVPAKYRPPRNTRSVEGFLFPATYTLRTNANPRDLASRQLAAFDDQFSTIDLTYAKSKNLTPYEVVVIASMIEREAQVDSERAKIAAVIYNRLRLRMTLGIDATIQYAVSEEAWKKELTESDLAINSPYNTYKQVGLPPTPIANPGLKSLQAAANPERNSKVLYYVAKDDGSGKHYFSNSLAEHEANANR